MHNLRLTSIKINKAIGTLKFYVLQVKYNFSRGENNFSNFLLRSRLEKFRKMRVSAFMKTTDLKAYKTIGLR